MLHREEEGASRGARAREENEQRVLSAPAEEELLTLICECARPDCQQAIAVTAVEYRAIYADPSYRIVALAHADVEQDEVVIGTGRYRVVRAGHGGFGRRFAPRLI